jgi:tRNA nucleotidyltransferase/poly(A) polymerase
VRDEILKVLAHPRASRGVRQLDQLGLLRAVVPEIEPMRACEQTEPHRFNALEHTLVVLDYLDLILAAATTPGANAAPWHLEIAAPHRLKLAAHFASAVSAEHTRGALFRLAVLLHDSGKPRTRTVDAAGAAHFYSHPLIGAELAAARANALRLSNDETRLLRATILHHMRPNLLAREGNVTPRALYRLARDAGDCLPELALLCAADGMGKAGEQTPEEDRDRRGKMASLLIERYYTQFAPGIAAPPLITGRDVLAIGVEPGSRIGGILEAVREAQMAGEIHTYDEAVRLARELAGFDAHHPGQQALP